LGVLSSPCSNHPIYLIWKEMNRKIFASFFFFFNVLNFIHQKSLYIKDWLLSIQPSPRVQPSILQFFFACTHPP
ncbi:unnamed protein product, partial [Brassica oleracea]